MAGNIKGITIELNGDSTKLTSAIDGVKRQSIGLQSELKEVDKLLKFNPGNADLVAQKQQNLSKQIEATAQKLDVLKQAQQQVEAQFAAGTLSEEKYNAFQREVINTEMALKNYKAQLETVNTSQQELKSKTQQLETLFKATDTTIDQYANTIGVDLLQAIKSGSASSKQLDAALNQIGKAALGSEIDVEKMKRALATVDDGASLKEVQKDLSKVAKEANSAEIEVNSFGDTIKDVITGLATGGGIAAVVSQALDVSSLNTKIDITLDVPEESKASVREAIKGVETYGVDAEAALEGVRRQWALNKNATDESNSAIIEGAGVIASSFAGVDFTELVQETNELAAGLKISNEDALALTNVLLKTGFPPEQLDTISEYGLQMKQAGYSTAEIQAIFEQGIDTKSWNIDNLNDGVKEARLQMTSFGREVPKALGDLLSKTDISSKKFQQWGKDVADGGDKGSKAMSEMANWLGKVKDKSLQNALATQIFGTKWEDQGPNMVSILEGLSDAQDKTKENQDELNSSIEKTNADPAVQMRKAIMGIQTAVAPLLVSIAKIVSSIAKWVSENSALAGVIAAVVVGVGLVVGVFATLAPIVMTIGALIGGVGAAFSAVLLPIIAVVAAVGLVAAAVVAIYQNWGGISEFFVGLWESIKTAFTTSITAISEFLSTVWDGIVTIIKSVWDGIKEYFTTVLNGYKTIFTTIWTGIKSAVTTIWNAIKTTATTVFNGIKAFFTTVLNFYKTIFTTVWNAIKSLVTTIWNGIKTTATTVFNAIKTTITTIFNAIKSVTTTVWNAIKSLISTVVNGIRSVITTVFNAIKSVVTTIWNAIKATSSSVWNSIKSVVSSVVNGIKAVVSTVFNAIRSVVSSVMNTVKSVISSAWNSAKSIVTSSVNGIKSIVTSVFNGLKNIVSTAMNGVKSAIESGWNKAKSFLDGINLVSVGKNIIDGLVNGIKNAAGAVKSAIQNIANGIPKAMKKLLGIHSPSRVMRDQVGYWVSEGLAKGITANKNAEKAAKQKAENIVKTYKEKLKELDTKFGAGMIDTKAYTSSLKKLKSAYGTVNGASTTIDAKIAKANTKAAIAEQKKKQQEQAKLAKAFNNKMTNYTNQHNADILNDKQYIKKLTTMKKTYSKVTNAVSKIDATIAKTRKSSYQDELKDLDNNLKAKKITNTQYISGLNKIKKTYSDVAGSKSAIDVKLASVNENLLKKQFADDKAYYMKKSKDVNTSMKEELTTLNTLAKGYKKNSEERIYFENLAVEKKQEIADAKVKIEEEYIEKVQKLDADYVAEYEALTAKYTKAVDDRTTAITNFAGIFDEVKLSEDVSGEQLLANLEGQTTTLENWMANLGVLAERGLDAGLLAELQALGPKSAEEIAALTTLSDEQLDQYTDLWQKKSYLARTQAISELEGMRTDTANQIVELQKKTEQQLTTYKNEWETSMKAVVGSVKNMSNQMSSIGAKTVQGLIDGINSKKKELATVASELSSIVASTTKTELDIHSPSRVMKKLGGYTTEGFVLGMQQAAKKLAGVSANVYSSLAKNAAVTTGHASNISTSRSVDKSKSQSNNINVYTQESPEKAIERTLNRMAFKFA